MNYNCYTKIRKVETDKGLFGIITKMNHQSQYGELCSNCKNEQKCLNRFDKVIDRMNSNHTTQKSFEYLSSKLIIDYLANIDTLSNAPS